MSFLAAPHTPPASAPTTPQGKRSFFGLPRTNRRHSLGLAMANGNPSLAVAASPNPSTPAGSGIPSFRTLRSLLPFGNSSKNASQSQTPSTPSSSRTSFGFGTVRRSMAQDRDRKLSLGNETHKSQVISIERSKSDTQVEEGNIRRSVSLSRLEDQLASFDPRSSDTAPVLRTPSPGIPLSQELSTIIEADSSIVSRLDVRIPLSRKASSSSPESRSPSPTVLNPAFLQPLTRGNLYDSASTAPTSDFDGDTSMLDVSPRKLKREVLDAMRASDSPSISALDWSDAGQPVIIDADCGNDSFAFESSILPEPDPELVALLSPNTMAAKTRERQPASFLPRLRHGSQNSVGSPTSARFPPSPKTPTSATATPRHSPQGSPSPNRNSPVPKPPDSPLGTTSTPAGRRSFMANSTHLFTPAASSSLSQSTGTKLFNPPKSASAQAAIGKGRPSVFRNMLSGNSSSRMESNDTFSNPMSPTLPRISLSTPPSPSKSPNYPRASLDSRRSPVRSVFPETPRRPSLDTSRPRLEGIRRTSFEVRRATPSSATSKLPSFAHPRSRSSPERADARNVPETPYRPSLDSARPSFDSSRPSSVARTRDRTSQTSSLRGASERSRTSDRLSPVPHSGGSNAGSSRGSAPLRTRKRSMSVQEHMGRTRLGQMSRTNGSAYDLATTSSASRPTTSMSSTRYSDAAGGEPLARPDWMNARGASRTLRGAGLLRDRDPEREGSETTERSSLRSRRDRSGSLTQDSRGHNGIVASSPLSGGSGSQPERSLGKLGSTRGAASDYNPSHQGRAISRMAFSDVGGAGPSGHRRGSGSFSAQGGGSGAIESPTFSASSSSRDRDRDRETPRSAISTAATSVSAYGGRDREEIRDLKDKHAIEMEALLNALSDTQRTVRMLREENSSLRDRLEGMSSLEAENAQLEQMFSELQRDVAQMKRQNEVLREQLDLQRTADLGRRTNERLSPQWNSVALRTPVPKHANPATSRYEHDFRPEDDVDTLNIPIPVNGSAPVFGDEDEDDTFDPHDGDELMVEDLASSTPPPSTKHIRRGSDTSSLFPMPPPNMSMIMQEDDPGHSFLNQTQANGVGMPGFNLTSTPMKSGGFNDHPDYNHSLNMSISSAMSFNRTLAGSPTESLRLDPQHDQHLRDLEQVDLGVKLEEMRQQHLGRLMADPDAW